MTARVHICHTVQSKVTKVKTKTKPGHSLKEAMICVVRGRTGADPGRLGPRCSILIHQARKYNPEIRYSFQVFKHCRFIEVGSIACSIACRRSEETRTSFRIALFLRPCWYDLSDAGPRCTDGRDQPRSTTYSPELAKRITTEEARHLHWRRWPRAYRRQELAASSVTAAAACGARPCGSAPVYAQNDVRAGDPGANGRPDE